MELARSSPATAGQRRSLPAVVLCKGGSGHPRLYDTLICSGLSSDRFQAERGVYTRKAENVQHFSKKNSLMVERAAFPFAGTSTVVRGIAPGCEPRFSAAFHPASPGRAQPPCACKWPLLRHLRCPLAVSPISPKLARDAHHVKHDAWLTRLAKVQVMRRNAVEKIVGLRRGSH